MFAQQLEGRRRAEHAHANLRDRSKKPSTLNREQPGDTTD
jgi:hypothetical protein